MKRIALIGLITVFLATVAYALIEPKNVNRAIDWVWSGNITTTGDFTMAEATITSATITNLTFPLTQTITANTYFDDGSGASPSLGFHDGTDEATTFTKVDSGYLTITSEAADGVNILVGNLKVGNGTPGQTINGEDAYIEGLLEVDGVIYADGGVSGAVNGTIGAGTPAAGAFTTGTFSGAVATSSTLNGNTAVRVMSYNFYDVDVAASQSAAVWGMDASADVGGANFTEITVPWTGSIIGISATSNAAVTTGTLTADATIDGTVTGFQAILNSTYQRRTNTQAKDADPITNGQRLGVKVTTSDDWNATSADVVVTIWYEF